jgi:hypothetical protein
MFHTKITVTNELKHFSLCHMLLLFQDKDYRNEVGFMTMNYF